MLGPSRTWLTLRAIISGCGPRCKQGGKTAQGYI